MRSIAQLCRRAYLILFVRISKKMWSIGKVQNLKKYTTVNGRINGVAISTLLQKKTCTVLQLELSMIFCW